MELKRTIIYLKRNWRLRLVTSIVSMSITSSFLKPDKAKSFNNSHPNPPAPTTNTFTYSARSSLNYHQPTKKTQKANFKKMINSHSYNSKRNCTSSVWQNVTEKKKKRIYFLAWIEVIADNIAGAEKELVEVPRSAWLHHSLRHFCAWVCLWDWVSELFCSYK